MRRICLVLVMLTISGLGSGCDELWELEYGKPAAQFLEEDLAASGDLFEGKNITVKGTVSQVDVSDPKAAWVHLTGGTKCNLRHLNVMAESCKIGDTVYVDGILKRCEQDDILLDPAVLRDPSAPFSPKQ